MAGSVVGWVRGWVGMCVHGKLEALVYDILPSTTAVFSYAIGPRKLSANEQCFVLFCVGAQTVVSLNNSDYIRRLECVASFL